MKVGSVCSGIGAPETAWAPLGWEHSFASEIEKFPRAVFSHHFPHIPLHGDFTTIKGNSYDPIDLLVGGTPCQSFSIAGLRGGMADDRGNLALEFLRLANRARPDWVVWENVPGVLSSWSGEPEDQTIEEWEETNDFASFLNGLSECGYGWAYRILDAQYVRVQSHPRAVPQRRRRVIVVGYLGDWRRAAAVLFERESLRGHSTPCRKTREVVAALTSSGVGTCGPDDNQAQDGHLIPEVCGTLSDGAHNGGGLNGQDAYSGRIIPVLDKTLAFSCKDNGRDASQGVAPTLRSMNSDKSHANGGGQMAIAIHPHVVGRKPENGPQGKEYLTDGSGYTMDGRGQPQIIAFTQNQRNEVREVEVPGALAAEPGMKQQTYLCQGWAVRRLTPLECERLQGFPDHFTKIEWRGKSAENCPDGPRYKALGNSMAINVMSWVGERIEMINNLETGEDL